MQIPSAARTAGIALLLGAALVLGSGVAFADDADEKTEEKSSSTTGQMHVVVQDSDGKRTVKVLEMKDGKWVAVEGDEKAAEGDKVLEFKTPRIRMRRGGGPGAVMLKRQGEPGKGVAVRKAVKSPMSSVLRWLLQSHGEGMQGKGLAAHLDAWFEGSDVPLQGLRDALKADGWNANTLTDWMHEHMAGSHGALQPHTPKTHTWFGQAPTPHARAPQPHPGMHGFWGMRPPMPWGMPHGYGMWGPPRTHTQSKAYMLWHDGRAWQKREIPMGHGAMMPYGMMPPMMPYAMPWGGYGMPWGHGPWMNGPAGRCGNCPCPQCKPKAHGAGPGMHFFGPAGAGGGGQDADAWLKHLPAEIREALQKRGFTGKTWNMLEVSPESAKSLHQLFRPGAGSCEDCPNKGRRKGKGSCGEGCKGDCESCPNKGQCKKQGKADCCGTCK